MIAFGKGAFGGGTAILGVPLLALVVDPLTAAIMMAPLVSAMDPFAIGAFPLRTWSWPDIAWLVPGMMAGLGLGALFFVAVDPRVVALGIALITLWFTGRWFVKGRTHKDGPAAVAPAKALVCGAAAGFTTFVAHGGNPPLAIYLLPRRLPKSVYAGTTVALFTISNTVKLAIYVAIAIHDPQPLWLAAALMPAIPLGVYAGKVLHDPRYPRCNRTIPELSGQAPRPVGRLKSAALAGEIAPRKSIGASRHLDFSPPNFYLPGSFWHSSLTSANSSPISVTFQRA